MRADECERCDPLRRYGYRKHEEASPLPSSGQAWQTPEELVLAPRGNSDVSLNAILKKLVCTGLSTPVDIIWTCCRSPFGGVSKGTCEWIRDGGLETRSLDKTKVTDNPGLGDHELVLDSVDGRFLLVHQSDVHAVANLMSALAKDVSTIGDDKGKYSSTDMFGTISPKNPGSGNLSF